MPGSIDEAGGAVETTIHEVAQRAGVSTATVSRSLRGRSGVSLETAKRVREIAEQMGYSASPLASRLASGHTRTVAVVLPYLDRWFYGEILGAAEPILRGAGLDLLLYRVGDADARHAHFSFQRLRKRVDGVLLVTLGLTDVEVEALRALGVPVGLVGFDVEGFESVRIDDVAAASTAVQHLLNLGHEQIGLICGNEEDQSMFTVARDRRFGYRAALEAAGIAPDPDLEISADFSAHGGLKAAAQLFGRRRRPSAIFAESDEMAFGAMSLLHRLGRRVPDDVSVIGFDDHPMAEVLDLTTMCQRVAEQGRLIAVRMVAALDDPRGAGTEPIHLAPELVVRKSTAARHTTRRRAPPGALYAKKAG